MLEDRDVIGRRELVSAQLARHRPHPSAAALHHGRIIRRGIALQLGIGVRCSQYLAREPLRSLHPDERIAWASDGDVTHAGVVTFHRIDDDTTRVALQLDWEPEGFLEKVGAAVGIDDASVRGDLKRFKSLIEGKDGGADGRWDGDIDREADATGH